ncbi:S24 family peptidase [Agrobacterium sp. S2/73]|uniref:S24 family peptidase n=1 Tax=unclassified Agrobacterium TaxID=2632611 RepID=UPI001ADC6E7D|nr:MULTISPECIES: S24 family peptidase [unclassified Agrobacterium]MBO9108726.1 S24 family peptidase [Agrobacterium sp. S2/73]QXZ73515.1 S24 family peptidase [Agrobacterium sp. S7/73]
MNDLFAPAVPAENVLSSKLRVHMVDGDGMEPELRSRRDYVLLSPTSTYCGEGIYLIDVGGGSALYRVQNIMAGKLLMKLDNPLYRGGDMTMSREEFTEIALAIVVADIRVRDERFLREAV